MQLKCWVFATGNSYANLIEPLLSRFVILIMPEYSFDEFIEIASGRLKRECQ
jgi:ATP-dependent Lon protease